MNKLTSFIKSHPIKLYCLLCYITMYILISRDDIKFNSELNNFDKGFIFLSAPIIVPAVSIYTIVDKLGKHVGEL